MDQRQQDAHGDEEDAEDPVEPGLAPDIVGEALERLRGRCEEEPHDENVDDDHSCREADVLRQ